MKDVLTVKSTEKNTASGQVEQYYCIAPKRKRTETVVRFIEAAPGFYGIIFCQTRALTSEVMEQLVSMGFKANCLHGDMKQGLRNQVIKGFRNKDFNILVATDVAARGIDVSDLTHVINFSLPDEQDSYIHRIGRTGRAGKKGIAITLIAPSERHKIRRLERRTNAVLQEISVPSLDVIINVKMIAVSDFIEQSKHPEGELSPVQKTIKDLINSFSKDEIEHAFAIALEDKFFKDVVHENLSRVSPDLSSVPQEICIDLGTDTGFTEDIVRNYLYGTCKLIPEEIQKLRVLNRKTFISIPENRLRDCLKLM